MILLRLLGMALLAIATLGFGAMGLCGGVFSVATLPPLLLSGEFGGLVFLVISLPCAYIGFKGARLCSNRLSTMTRSFRSRGGADDTHSP